MAIDEMPKVSLYSQSEDLFQRIYSQPGYLKEYSDLYLIVVSQKKGADSRGNSLLDSAVERQTCADQDNLHLSKTFYALVANILLKRDDNTLRCARIGLEYLGSGASAGLHEADALWWRARFNFVLGDRNFVQDARGALERSDDNAWRASQIKRWLACAGVQGYYVSQGWICRQKGWPEIRLNLGPATQPASS